EPQRRVVTRCSRGRHTREIGGDYRALRGADPHRSRHCHLPLALRRLRPHGRPAGSSRWTSDEPPRLPAGGSSVSAVVRNPNRSTDQVWMKTLSPVTCLLKLTPRVLTLIPSLVPGGGWFDAP